MRTPSVPAAAAPLAPLPPPAIECTDVSFAYDGGQDVLDSVTLRVERGAFLAIIGPNGGGKTTLVKLLLGMLRPRRGTVQVLGADPAAEAPNVGYVPQHSSFEPGFPITVLDVVLLGLVRGGREGRGNGSGMPWFGLPRSRRADAMDALSMVNMEGHASRRFDTLSGGQRQRVLVARGLVSRPELLIFDEPTSNIDPQGKTCLFEVLAGLRRSITVVLVSHDLISATAGITDVAVVNGRLLQESAGPGGRGVTPEMLELVYGTHGAQCPLDGYMQSLSAMFNVAGHDHHHGHGHHDHHGHGGGS